MPSSPKPTFDPRFGHLTPAVQAVQLAQQKIQQQNAGANQGLVVDLNGNCTELYGANLDQVVTIGSTATTGGPTGKPGVLVRTGIASGTAGRATAQNVAMGTITLTKGSTSATLVSTTSGSFGNGMVIGAADVSDPSLGIATPAIAPGTTMTISGTAITLSQPAAESGSGIFCAACNFVLAEPGAWQALSLPAGNFAAAAGYWTPQGRLTGDVVTLRGAVQNVSGGTLTNPVVATVPILLVPQAVVLFGTQWALSSPLGNLTFFGAVANGANVGLDGLTYTAIAA